MHVFQRKSFHAVLLMSLGGMGCDLLPGHGEEKPPPNQNPTISQVSASPTSINEGESTTLTVTASDADGDALTYSWTQNPASPPGTFSGEGMSRTWTAPLLASDTLFTLEASVLDGRGGTASATVDVAVANVPTVNRAPLVDEAITGAAPVIAGDTLELSIGATDPDGDVLTYSWMTEPAGAGTFTNPGSATAQWRSGDLATATPYTLSVTVSDGTDSVTRSVAVEVGVPSYAAHIQPIWTANCTSCHNSSTGTRGGLNLEEGKSHASLVNMSAAGTPCGPTGLKRVVPSEPDNSLLVMKLGSTPPCGARMPTTDTTFFDRNPGLVTRIRSWILAGAPND